MGISSEIHMMAVCLIPLCHCIAMYLYSTTGHLTCKPQNPSYTNLIKNPRAYHVHNSLSNVVTHIPCINIHCAGHYQLEMAFTCVHFPPIAMGNTLHGSDYINCFCSKIKRYKIQRQEVVIAIKSKETSSQLEPRYSYVCSYNAPPRNCQLKRVTK